MLRSGCWRRSSSLPRGFCKGFPWAANSRARPPFWSNIGPTVPGFFASWQWSSQGFAALVATGLGVLLTTTMSADTLQAWGWRIPFAVGLLIGPVGYYIRNRLDETPEFVEAGEARTPLRDLFGGQWDRLLLKSPPRPVRNTSSSTCRPMQFGSSTCRNR